jgi:SAM-dependent methyltransferase
MSLLERIHAQYIQERRLCRLVHHLKDLIPRGARVLDVGCGDGRLAHLLKQERGDITIKGIDVLIRDQTWIDVQWFDGCTIPYDSASVDVLMFVDVLHHTGDPTTLLREARRVTRQSIIIKDHVLDGFLAGPTLRFMDGIGNARFGVALPHNYWFERKWLSTFRSLAVTPVVWRKRLSLYPNPLDLLFGRSLHFLTKLNVDSAPLEAV